MVTISSPHGVFQDIATTDSNANPSSSTTTPKSAKKVSVFGAALKEFNEANLSTEVAKRKLGLMSNADVRDAKRDEAQFDLAKIKTKEVINI